MLVSDLQWEDLQALKLQSSSLNSNKDMLVIDLIMELSHFLDESLIESYERQIKGDSISLNYNLPSFMFKRLTSNNFQSKENLVEESIIDKTSEMKENEIDILEEMFKTFKIEGYKERKRYEELCKNFRSNIEAMNKQILRSELIQEYIKVMEEEFMSEYNPKLVE